MRWASANRLEFDTIVIYTDNETWFGNIHPMEALRAYRQQVGLPTKLIVVGLVATEFSIADPTDPFALDVVGFDTRTPDLISRFSAG